VSHAGRALKKVALTTGATLASINIWTGAPLLALWIGSRAFYSAPEGLTLGAVSFVVVVMGIFEFLLLVVLTRLNAAYDELIGRPLEARRTSPWLRMERTLREPENRTGAPVRRTRVPSTPVEIAAMASAAAAVVTLEGYFFYAYYVVHSRCLTRSDV
jgi:hypothetical protein